MIKRAASIRQISDRLCAQAVELHQAIIGSVTATATAEYTHQLIGIRTALCLIHGGSPATGTPSDNPATALITDWWQHHHPTDWHDHHHRQRHGEQLYIHLHELLHHSPYDSVVHIARVLGLPRTTAYWTFATPGRSRWSTLEPYINALGGHHDELRQLWHAAYEPPHTTTPPTRRGRGLTPQHT